MPLVGYLDNLLRLFLVCFVEAKRLCVLDYLVDIVWLNGIEYIEEVLSLGKFAAFFDVSKELIELCIRHDIFHEALDAELVILGDGDGADLVPRDEILLAGEDLLEEVFVDVGPRRHVVLAYNSDLQK